MRDWSGFAQAFVSAICDTGEKEDREDGSVLPWRSDSGFDEPPVVADGEDACGVNEAVEALPVFAADGSHDEGGRCDGKGEEDEPGEETDLDEAALEDVVPDGGPDVFPFGDDDAGVTFADAGEDGWEIVTGEEEDVGGEVKRCVEEGVETDEPTEADEPRDSRREAADRRDGEAGEKYPECPIAGEVRDVVDGVRIEGECARGIEVQEREEGQQAEDVNDGFEKDDGALRHVLAKLSSVEDAFDAKERVKLRSGWHFPGWVLLYGESGMT